MDLGKNRLSPEAERLQHGLALANRRMLEKAAKMGYDLVLGNLGGGYVIRNAADVLAETRGDAWWTAHFDD